MRTVIQVRRGNRGTNRRVRALAITMAVVAVLLPSAIAVARPAAAAVPAADEASDTYPRTPLWVYGHSYTTSPGTINTPGQEWMPKLAEQLGLPRWRTFGVRSSRIIDTYGDLARQAVRGPVRGSTWDPARRGLAGPAQPAHRGDRDQRRRPAAARDPAPDRLLGVDLVPPLRGLPAHRRAPRDEDQRPHPRPARHPGGQERPGPGAVYLDQLLVQAAAPLPVVVVKDPAPLTTGNWITTPSNQPTVVANRRLLHSQIDAVTRQFPNVATVLLDVRPGYIGHDGVHLSDLGMQYEAGLLAQRFREFAQTYDIPVMYE